MLCAIITGHTGNRGYRQCDVGRGDIHTTAPFPPPPFPPHPPAPPRPPAPPPSWQYPWYYNNHWPYLTGIVWRWPSHAYPRVIYVEPPQPLPVYAPVISSFTANPSYIQSGQAIVLTWYVSNATSVALSPSVGSVSSSGSYNVTPGYTTTYTLSATNSAGSVSASTTVTVAPYVSSYNLSSGSQIAGAATAEDTGNNGIFALGLGSNNGAVNPMLLYILLISLLATAAVGAVVFLARRPVAAASGASAGTRAGRLPWTTTRVSAGTPQTTPLAMGPGPKFVLSDGVHIPI